MRFIAIFFATATLLLAACNSQSPQYVPRPLAKKANFALYLVSPLSTANTKTESDPETGKEIYLITPAVITASDVASVHLTEDSPDGLSLNVIFTPSGTVKLSKATETTKGMRLAIVINDKVESAPVIRSNLSNNIRINGGKSVKDREALFNLLTRD